MSKTPIFLISTLFNTHLNMTVPATCPEVSWLDYFSALGSALAIIVSASIATYTAWRGFKIQRGTSRRNATADLLFRLEVDPEYLKAEEAFKDARDSEQLISIFESKSANDKQAMLDVLCFMNHYELICCSIAEDSLDEIFYLRWYQHAFLTHWNQLKPLILHLREKRSSPEIFTRFQHMAECWERNEFVTLKKSKPSDYSGSGSNQVKHYQDS